MGDDEYITAEELPTRVEDTYCMSCNKTGVTLLNVINIPNFGNNVISSFACSYCDYRNNEIMSTHSIKDTGIKYKCLIANSNDLKRFIIKYEKSTIYINEIDLEIVSQNSNISTIEGLLYEIYYNLYNSINKYNEDRDKDKEDRNRYQIVDSIEEDKDGVVSAEYRTNKAHIDNKGNTENDCTYKEDEADKKLKGIVDFLYNALHGEECLTISIDDPTGNSYIEELGSSDPNLRKTIYYRSKEQNESLGLVIEKDDSDRLDVASNQSVNTTGSDTVNVNLISQDNVNTNPISPNTPNPANTNPTDANQDEDPVYRFQTECSSCSNENDTNMTILNIPYFQEIIIMATICDHCGYKSNEIKSNGPVSSHGSLYMLTINSHSDLTRDVITSETCSINIPSLDFKLEFGKGRFTSIEGLLIDLKDSIMERNPLYHGDSIDKKKRYIIESLIKKFDNIINGIDNCIIELNDPLSNSYISNPNAPLDDKNLMITKYERSYEQNDTLGLNDMDC
eukprot:GHVP01005174.1.p1 GENE.GHVP01005174.1~~GHVP01005174.1.p1  ORF type:complete len:508 (+),score=61.33 GHVP01005174.1:936-2459(+)